MCSLEVMFGKLSGGVGWEGCSCLCLRWCSCYRIWNPQVPFGVQELYSCRSFVLCFQRWSLTAEFLSRYCLSSCACVRGWCVCSAVRICKMCIRVLVCECGTASAIVICFDDDVPYASWSMSVRYVLSREGL